jgi:signal transduction histidine kinase
MVDSSKAEPLPEGTEWRLTSFTELVASAIANTEARLELTRLADEQSALRRVATLVAYGLPQEDTFAAVAEEVGRLLRAQVVHLNRLDGEDVITTVAAWSEDGDHIPVGTRLSLEGESATALVVCSRQPARVDAYANAPGPIAAALRERGIHSAVGCPVMVEGRLWGAMVVASTEREPHPEDTEERLAAFTELVATAIADAHARAEVRRLAQEQAALRRVATLVARESSAAELLGAVAEEVAVVLGADVAQVLRYEADGSATAVAGWSEVPLGLPLDVRLQLDGDTVASRVRRTGAAARIDSYADVPGEIAAMLRASGVRSSVGAPIVVEGQLWGAVIAATAGEEQLPAGTEGRIAEFTELVATAIANADSRAKLAASRARVVAASDDARRRIERNLHDGAQQRLISLGLRLRAVEAMAPPDLAELRLQLSEAVTGLTGVLDELQELSRGLHPAILSQAGLGAALKALARRSAVPIELDVCATGRLPERVEAAAYYVVSEAVANATKHARATVLHVEVGCEDGGLAVAVRDDGVGGADPEKGSGLVGLADRVEALGGTLTVASPVGEGTALAIRLPLEPA